MKPSRKKPRAKEINPTWVDVRKQWKNFGEYEHACTVIAVATANATASGSDGEVWGSAQSADATAKQTESSLRCNIQPRGAKEPHQ
jgi:hypothetical protein